MAALDTQVLHIGGVWAGVRALCLGTVAREWALVREALTPRTLGSLPSPAVVPGGCNATMVQGPRVCFCELCCDSASGGHPQSSVGRGVVCVCVFFGGGMQTDSPMEKRLDRQTQTEMGEQTERWVTHTSRHAADVDHHPAAPSPFAHLQHSGLRLVHHLQTGLQGLQGLLPLRGPRPELPSAKQRFVLQLEGQPVLAALEGQPVLAALEGQLVVVALEGQSVLAALEGQSVLAALEGQSVLATPEGQSVLAALEGQSVLATPGGQSVLAALEGQSVLAALEGQLVVVALEGQSVLATPEGQSVLAAPENQLLLVQFPSACDWAYCVAKVVDGFEWHSMGT